MAEFFEDREVLFCTHTDRNHIEAFDAAVKSEGFQQWVATSGVSMDVVLGEDYQKIDQQYYDTVMSYKEYLG